MSTETWWDRRSDLAVAILLATVTVLLAWSGFQASKWSGVQAINFSDAGRARVDSNALNSAGASQVSTDTGIFISWLEAAQPAFAANSAPEGVTSGAGLAPFLYQNSPTACASLSTTGSRRAPLGREDRCPRNWTAMSSTHWSEPGS